MAIDRDIRISIGLTEAAFTNGLVEGLKRLDPVLHDVEIKNATAIIHSDDEVDFLMYVQTWGLRIGVDYRWFNVSEEVK